MKRPLKIVIFVILSCIVLFIIASLVWGKTLAMAEANRLLLASKPRAAQAIYEKLLAASPDSPYILHNLGLAFYKESQYDQAVANLSRALKKIETPDGKPSTETRPLLNHTGYNLGNAFFKQAEKSASMSANSDQNSYQSALENYQKAIMANRSDLDAKYNYEVTKIRLQQAQKDQSSRQEQPKNKNQQDQQQKKSNQSQNASDKQNKSKNQSGQQHSNSGPQKGQMTKAEAEALLQMMKSQDQSKDPVVSGQEAPPKQDW